jgi:small nuclear ribonucleoprotein (snRNP)-like protein
MSKSLGIPVKLLHESEGHIVTVELKSGELYRGSLIECEDNWNCQLENITYTAKVKLLPLFPPKTLSLPAFLNPNFPACLRSFCSFFLWKSLFFCLFVVEMLAPSLFFLLCALRLLVLTLKICNSKPVFNFAF